MLYPNIDNYRDRDDDSNRYTPSCLEKNCNQIFVKGQSITEEIYEKVNSDIVPKKTSIFGKKMRVRRLIYLSALVILFLFSTFGTIVFWFTDTMNDLVLSQMIISNDSATFPLWQKPPVKALYKTYIFNYTNHKSYQNGIATKLKVQELGPYVYEETQEKVNLEWEADTVTYQTKTTYKFRPDLSKGKESDIIVVPNMPLIGGVAISKNMNYFSRVGLSALFSGLNEEPFIQLDAGSYITGYDSKINTFSQYTEAFTNVKSPKRIGLLAEKEGLVPYIYKMNRGFNITEFGTFETINGDEFFHYYSSKECDRVSSTDGAIYPPKRIQAKQPLRFFFPEMCRTYPLNFNKEITILDGSVTAYQYKLPENIYNYSVPENQCYCGADGVCPLNGLHNISVCAFGTPMFASLPHFRGGDPQLFEHIDGLNPNVSDYTISVDVHPKMGFVMSAKSTAQLNIQVQKVYPIHLLDFFPDNIVLPIAWFGVELKEEFLTPVFLDLIYESTFTVNRVEQALKYGCVLTSVITLIFIILIVARILKEPKKSPTNGIHRQSVAA